MSVVLTLIIAIPMPTAPTPTGVLHVLVNQVSVATGPPVLVSNILPSIYFDSKSCFLSEI